MIKHFLNPPNWFTSASILCSTCAVALLLGGHEVTPQLLSQSSMLVILGGVFDLLDGRVARITNRFTEFGVQLDSIADVMGFGLAPALIAYAWLLKDLGWTGLGITVWYVVCAAFRLARFNVNTSERSWPLNGHSQGLTSTMAGGCLVTIIWVSNGYLIDHVWMPVWGFAGLVWMLGLLMISSVPFRNFKDLRGNPRARRMMGVAVAACLSAAVLFDWSMWWGVGGALYLTVGLVDGLVVAAWHRRLSKALMIDDLEEAFNESPTEPDEPDDQPVTFL